MLKVAACASTEIESAMGVRVIAMRAHVARIYDVTAAIARRLKGKKANGRRVMLPSLHHASR